MKLAGLLTLCLLLAGCAGRDSSGPAGGGEPPGSSSTAEPPPVGDAEERLEVASRLRRELRGQADVVVNGTKLVVTYKSAAIDDAPDDFLGQQGKAGMARIANAGFVTLVVSARGAGGAAETKEIPVAAYRTK